MKLPDTKIFRPTFRDGRADVFPELEREFGLGMTTPRQMAELMADDRRGARGESGGISHRDGRHAAPANGQGDDPRLLPPGIEVGNKTGTDSEKLADANGHRGSIRADAAIVTGPGLKLQFVAIYTRRGADATSGIDNAALMFGAELARLVFEHFARAER